MSAPESRVYRFQCPQCRASLRVRDTRTGARHKCPKCAHVFTLPRGSDAAVSPVRNAQPRRDAELIPVVCGVCRTRMYATMDQIGQFMECPDCFSPNPVKQPLQKPRASAPLEGDQFSYEMDAVDEVTSARTQARELLIEAGRQVEKTIAEAPVLPRRPFVNGVLTFPFRLHVLPVTVGMTLSLTVVLGAIKMARDLLGQAALMAPVVSVMAALLAGGVLVSALVCWMKVLENTVQGEDEADYRPDGGLFAFIDWIGETLYLIVAISISAMPVFLIADLAGLRGQALAWQLVPILVAAIPFPVVLLSMLESNSPLMPFSKPIWSSLVSLTGTWCVFSFMSLTLVGCAAAAGLAAWYLTGREWTPLVTTESVLLVFCFVAALTVYFRLLGRLGWVLTQKVVVYVDEETEDDRGALGHAADRETSIV